MSGINQRRSSETNSLRHLQCGALVVLGTLLTVPRALAAQPAATSSPHRILLISLADRKLALVEDGRAVKVYDIAIGKPRTPSPTGNFHVANKLVRPTWYHRGQVIRPGSNNPLGPRWIGLSRPGYGIHGTNEPDSIGKAASHGCIRMRSAEAKELFKLVQVGDAVEIHRSHDEVVSHFFPENLLAGQAGKSEGAARPSASVVRAEITGAPE